MHDIRWIRDNAAAFDAALKRRGLEPQSPSLIALDEKRRAAIVSAEQALARRNAASKEIGDAKKAKDEARANALMAEVNELKTKLPELEAASKEATKALDDALAWIPNLPFAAPDVPDGADEHGNVEHHHFGAKKVLGFAAKQHDDLGKDLDDMDFETAAKISGARFVVLKKGLARLERALGQFMLDVHTGEHGIYRGQSAAVGARRGDVRHDAIAEVRRGSVLGDLGRGAERRSPMPSRPNASGSSRPPKSPSPTSSANPSSTRRSCRCASPRSRRASAPKRAPRGATRAA